ncbi:MAG: Histidine kinase, gyrase and HSP90-like ATPase [Pseudomonadota bacterium]
MAERERIFEPFYRARLAGEAPRGAGLGLAIAREIARAHGGDVHVEAVPATGFGARFVALIACGLELSAQKH